MNGQIFFFLFLGFLVYRDEKHSKEEKKNPDWLHAWNIPSLGK